DIRGGCVTHAISALHGLSTVTPCSNPTRVDDLALHVKSVDQECVSLVLEVLKHRARVLSHEDRVRGVVMDAKLISDTMSLADAMQCDPGSGGVGQVVVPGIAGRPPRHRALLDPIHQAARF